MKLDVRRLISECPTVVGMITTSVESGGSLDTAARSIAETGPLFSRELFSRAVRIADTKGADGIPRALSDEVGKLPESASGYRNAVLLCISASESGTQEERLRLLREASDISLDSVRGMGERYSSALTVPCMTVFGLGIMVPMILMSIVPLLGVGGLFGSFTIDSGLVVLITLVLIPAVILGLTLWIRRSNPFLSAPLGMENLVSAAPLLLAIPLAAFQMWSGSDPETVILLSVAPACIVSLVTMAADRRRERKRSGCESGLRDTVFEIGNLMMSGESFETACPRTLKGRAECDDIGVALEREMAICRGDLDAAVVNAVSPVSAEVSRAFRDILRCSERDTEDAGRLAMALGRQFHNADGVLRDLEMKLKSMKDMMSGTAVLFAPLVLGMSVAMLGPLSTVAGYQEVGDTGAILSVYLVELCALIAVLSSNLGAGEGAGSTVWRFCTMAPVALVVFTICCGLSL